MHFSRVNIVHSKGTSVLFTFSVMILLFRCHGYATADVIALEEDEKVNATTATNTFQEWRGEQESTTRSGHADAYEEEDEDEPLLFHSNCGQNAVVSEDGRTVYTINEEDDEGYSGVVTSRPLRDWEPFEVVHWDRFNETSKQEYIFDIGVTEYSPEELQDFPRRMEDIEAGNWLPNWTLPIDFKNGDSLGLMRVPNGTLHLFVNAVNFGEVATDVPEGVYGYVEIFSNEEIEISIVDPLECMPVEPEGVSSVYSQLNELNCGLSLG